jgi:PAS domain S-box-containing protein
MPHVSDRTDGWFRTWKFPATLVLMVMGLLFDAVTPRGVADWLIYLAPVALSSRYGPTRLPFYTAVICTLLTAWGFFLSEPGIIGMDLAIANRFMAVAAIWFTAVVFRWVRLTEDALRSESRFSSALLDTVGALVVVLDPGGRIVRFNRACEKNTGYTSAEAEGRVLWDFLLVPEEADRLETVFQELKATDFPNTFEGFWVGKSGERRLILWQNTALCDNAGRVEHVIGTGMDITDARRAAEERKKLEEQVRQSQKLESLGILAGGIAHDFNNMLTAILGNADLTLQEIPESHPARPMLQDIDEVAHRAAELCKQMLAYSGRGRFVVKPLDLSGAVLEIGRMLEASISKKAELHCHLAEGLPPIEADAAQVRQVIMNLIINASEAIGDKGGTIDVTTSSVQCDWHYLSQAQLHGDLAEGNYVCLEVADNGCGMDRATMDRIFDPFFTTKFTGRGLGLAAVLGIVRGHRGAIKPYSEPGKGTNFKVLFPAAAAADIQPRERTGEEDWHGSGTVLFVDDEATLRALGQRMLQQLGFDAMTAADGREALTLYERHRESIRCVLLDLTMPHMDGEETFRELRRMNPALPVILCSGYNAQEAINRFVGEQLAGFIQKPYRIANIRQALRAALGNE